MGMSSILLRPVLIAKGGDDLGTATFRDLAACTGSKEGR